MSRLESPSLSFSQRVEVIRESEKWAEQILDDALLIPEVVGIVLAHHHARSRGVTVVLSHADHVQTLNHTFRGKNKPTNILSFPYEESDFRPINDPLPLLGEMILSYETVLEEAQAQGKPFRDHLIHLLIHGTLHLLGFDHETEEEALLMEKEEVFFLSTHWSIPDPYSQTH